MRLDHVILAVRDLEEAADRLRREYGFSSLPGGRHAGEGTVNAVVPLQPPSYLELIAAEETAGRLGGPVSAALSGGERQSRWFGWAVEPDDLDAVSRRVRIEPETGSIEASDGGTASWRLLTRRRDFRWPFFIEYGIDPDTRLARWQERFEQARHETEPGAVAWLEVGGDEGDLRSWLGECDVPLRFSSGEPGLRAVAIDTGGGPVVLR